MHDILDRLTAFGKHMTVSIFFFGTEWKVKLEYSDKLDSLASNRNCALIERSAPTLEEALRSAWESLEQGLIALGIEEPRVNIKVVNPDGTNIPF